MTMTPPTICLPPEPLPTYRGQGGQPGVDLADASGLADHIDDCRAASGRFDRGFSRDLRVVQSQCED